MRVWNWNRIFSRFVCIILGKYLTDLQCFSGKPRPLLSNAFVGQSLLSFLLKTLRSGTSALSVCWECCQCLDFPHNKSKKLGFNECSIESGNKCLSVFGGLSLGLDLWVFERWINYLFTKYIILINCFSMKKLINNGFPMAYLFLLEFHFGKLV